MSKKLSIVYGENDISVFHDEEAHIVEKAIHEAEVHNLRIFKFVLPANPETFKNERKFYMRTDKYQYWVVEDY